MGPGKLRRNGNPGNYGVHVYDTRLTADTMTLTPNVTARDTTNWRKRIVTTTVTRRDTNVMDRSTHDGYSRHGLDECLRLVFKINYDYTIRLYSSTTYDQWLPSKLQATTWRTLRSTTERVSDTLRTVTIAVRERHYPLDSLVLRASRLRVLPVYVYCPFVIYTCLHSTSSFAPPTPLRVLRLLWVLTKSLRVPTVWV